jgi:hypothetical protein
VILKRSFNGLEDGFKLEDYYFSRLKDFIGCSKLNVSLASIED